MPLPKLTPGRKLLIASVGVAAVSYVGCSSPISGNLVGPGGVGGGDSSSTSAGSGGGNDAGCGASDAGKTDAACADGG